MAWTRVIQMGGQADTGTIRIGPVTIRWTKTVKRRRPDGGVIGRNALVLVVDAPDDMVIDGNARTPAELGD